MDLLVGLKQLGNRGVWVLTGIMAIVAMLGYQQYRWIVRVAAVEEKTNREKLEASLKRSADDFDTEITRAHLTFGDLAGTSPADVLQKAADRLREFRRLSEYPGLIASVDVVAGLPDPFNVDAGPPPALNALVAVVQARSESPGQYLAVQPFAETGSQRRVTAPGMRFGVTPLGLRIVLDQDYVAGVLLPKLLSRHLGSGFENHYDVLIREVQTRNVVRQSGRTTNQPWDVSRRILSIRPDCLTDPTDRGPVTLDSRATATLASLLQRAGKCGDAEAGTSGAWTLDVRAYPSLADATRTARQQNLGIGFGVLLILAITVGVLFVSAHRASELAGLHKQFAAGVSHELRTPLSIISSAGENLADGVVENPEQVRRYGQMIHSHSEQLAAMIENALWFAGKDAQGTLEAEEIDVEELVNTAVATCRRMLDEAGVVLDRDIEPRLPLIRGNRTLLLHGIQNLLTNIALYAHAGKWARVRAVRCGRTIEFTIEDHGAGILPEETERVFQPFYRGKGAKQANLAGLGLGLTLVRRIVEAHEGTIKLRSQRGIGTAVTFSVPIFGLDSRPAG